MKRRSNQGTLLSFGFTAKQAFVEGTSYLGENDGIDEQRPEIVSSVTDPSSRSTSKAEQNDIVQVAGSLLTATRRADLLDNVWRPPLGYRFPGRKLHGCVRHFRSSWLEKYPWLTYSPSKDGGYCLPCVLFAGDQPSLGQLIRTPMVYSARSCTTFSEHNSCKTHQKQAEFLVRAEGGHTTVAPRLVSHNEQLIAANRAKMI